MREIFEILSVFDWITPTKGFVEDMINDPHPLQSNSWTFFIPYADSVANGYNARQIERMLDEQGIKRWGSQITGGEFFFTVPKEQAHAAEYVLASAGVPIGLGAGAPLPPRPMSEMSNYTNFVPAGVVHVGPPGHRRLIKWLLCKVQEQLTNGSEEENFD